MLAAACVVEILFPICTLFCLVCRRMAKRKSWDPDEMQKVMEVVSDEKLMVSGAV